MEKSLEVTACKMAANNTHLTTREGSLAIPCGLAKQPGAFPSGSDLSLSTPSTPLDTIPEEEEPSQPEREGPYNGQQQFPAEKATTLVTKTSSAAVSAEKTTSSEDTHPCGMAEDAAEHITSELSGESKAPSAELGAASCDGGRHVTNPCAVQEEDCDLSITVLEKEKKDQSRQAMSGGKEVAEARADSFFEPGVSGATDLSETSTGNIPSGVVGSASPKCTSQLDPNVPSGTASAGTEVSVEHEAVGEAKPAPCSAQGSGEVSASVETWGTEQAGQESPRDLQEASGTEDNAEPPELEEPGGDLRGDVGTRSTEGDPARDSGKASAAGRVATEALPRKHRPPHCVPVSVDVHIDQAGCEAETQMVSDQVSLSDTDANPHQQPDGEDGGRLDTVVSSSSSSSVQETDSEEGRPGSVCSSVLNSMCEDKPLTCDDFVRSQQVQNFRAQSPKPSDNPDFDPSTPLSLGSLSDSQLNNIAFSPSECSETADDADNSSEQQEDATELVCGLIKELSSLNRTVMAAHRELDNLRRGNKASKPPHRHSYCSRHSEI
ncbi:hypothetical protein MATL_G00003540 [Megalops atlanticus]|uniref:Uncharacterized protein n=1 Tax=Megalops atlanticus TaxID=7932 RepID=A0A9D3TD60_MEGAT|nr:hypothetical protein MATL_G00003540 [Megalops atlanticus]